MSFTCAGCRGAGTYPQHHSGVPILCWACNGRGVNDCPTWRDPATHIVYKQNVEGESMNHRDLDRHITGNGGEDQYPEKKPMNNIECDKCGSRVFILDADTGKMQCMRCHILGNQPKTDTTAPAQGEPCDDDGC